MQTRLAVVFLSFLLAGCAGQLAEMPFNSHQITSYKMNQIQEASIGEPIIDVENASVRDAYEVLLDYQTPTLGLMNAGGGNLYLKKGDRFTVVAYDPQNPNTLYVREEGPELKMRFIQIHPDGHVGSGWVLSNGTIPVQGSWTKDQLFAKSNTPSYGAHSFKAEIIYSGISGNTVKAAYREFANDMARPAFSQDLEYNLSEGKTIAYRKIKIEVLKATNSSIQYKVLDDGGLTWLPK